MPVLICEGACNPGREQVDASVREWRRHPMQADGFVPLDSQGLLAQALRSLRHTTHAKDGAFYRCTCCGQLRRFGNEEMR